MNKTFKFLPLVAATAVLAGCQDYDLGFDAKEIAFKKNFEEKLGFNISPDQDWNLSSQITANYDLSNLPQGNYTVRIFSEHPASAHAMLLASYNVAGGSEGSFMFDAIKGSNQVFVAILSENNQLVDLHSVALDSSIIYLNKSNLTRSDSWSPSIGSKIDGGSPLFLNDGTAYIYPMNGLVEGPVSGLTKGDVKEIFLGEGAVFAEEVDNGATHPNLIRDVTFTMKQDGEFKMNLVWSITSNQDAFGYYYQDEDGVYHLYRIIDNIQNAFKFGDTGPISLQNGGINSISDETAITANVYKLAYVDKSGAMSNIFPQGTKIGFFIIPTGTQSGDYLKKDKYQDSDVLYSQKKLNWKVSSTLGNQGAHDLGNEWSAYFKYGDKLYLGFEDWKKVITSSNFNDYNDIVFYIDAPVEEAENPELDITPEKMTETIFTEEAAAIWTLAFEDLGDTDDFDFNDVVLQFKHVSGSKTAQVNLAAAGGTLNAHVNWNEEDKGNEVHAAFGVETTTPVNVGAGAEKATIEDFITIDDLADEFTISDLSKFALHVVYKDNSEETAALIPAGGPNTKGKAPQCLVIPGKWVWPKERCEVFNAYTQFGEWAKTGWGDKGSWEDSHRYGAVDNWYKPNAENNNYVLSLLTNDPTHYYTEEIGGPIQSDKVTVENGKVTYHVQLTNVGNSKYYGGTLYIKVADWKTDFSGESDYKTVVLKNVQSGSSYSLNISAASANSSSSTSTDPGYAVTVAADGSAQIAILLPSDFAQSLLGNYTNEDSNEANNKFDVTCYASSMDAWIISNPKPNNYAGDLPSIDAEEGSNYPYEIVIPDGATDLSAYLPTNSNAVNLPNNLFNHNGSITLHVDAGSPIRMSAYTPTNNNYYVNANTTGILTYGQNDFKLSASDVQAIYATNGGLNVQFPVWMGANGYPWVRAMWLTYGAQDPSLSVSSTAVNVEESDNKVVTVSYSGNGTLSAQVTEGADNAHIVVSGKTITIYGDQPGDAKILVTLSADGSDYDAATKEINVTVTAQDNRQERNITVAYNPSTITSAGGTAALEITGVDAEGVTFTYTLVDGSDFVTLNTTTGAVTAKANGTAHVKIQADGDTDYKPFDETIAVEVNIDYGTPFTLTSETAVNGWVWPFSTSAIQSLEDDTEIELIIMCESSFNFDNGRAILRRSNQAGANFDYSVSDIYLDKQDNKTCTGSTTAGAIKAYQYISCCNANGKPQLYYKLK